MTMEFAPDRTIIFRSVQDLKECGFSSQVVLLMIGRNFFGFPASVPLEDVLRECYERYHYPHKAAEGRLESIWAACRHVKFAQDTPVDNLLPFWAVRWLLEDVRDKRTKPEI